MRYSQLRAFHYVALHGGFSRAAKVMNLSQPALSDQVRKLEQAHDVLLFHRQTRQIRLTEAGENLFLLTKQYFEVEENIGDFLSQSRSTITGTLRIVADSALHITVAIGRFRVMHPKIFVSIQTGNTEEVLRRLRNYDAEVGVVANLSSGSDFDTMDLGRTPIVGIVARGLLPKAVQSIDISELPRWPLIFREHGSRTRLGIEEAAAHHGMVLRPVIEVDGREAMREVVASGAGIGFVSEAEFGFDKRLIKLPLTGIDLGMTETLVTLTARREVPVIRAFLRSLKT